MGMKGTLLADAFGHHAWATLRIIDTCASLTEEELLTTVPGTYGSIVETLRHTVGADVGYLAVLAPGEVDPPADEDALGLVELRSLMVACADAWARFLERDLDPGAELTRHRDDGSTSIAPATIRIAQVLHHGTDHRSQIATALTSLGIEPPEIDVWAYAEEQGRLRQTPPTTPAGAG